MKQKLRTLIAKGKTQQAIQELLVLTQQMKDKDFHKDVIMQSARFEEYSQSNRLGISSNEEEGISIAKINKTLLDIIDRIPEKITTSEFVPKANAYPEMDTPPSGKWWNWVVGLGLLIAIPAGLAEFSGYSLKDLFSSTSTASNTVTVLVHGKKGKDNLVLPNRGIVKLIYGDAIVSKQINADGEATFKQVRDVFFEPDVEVELVFQDPKGEPYRATHPNSRYKLTKGKYISLEVRLYGLGEVNGIVKDFKTSDPIEGARISIQREEAFSNEHGEFTISLPEEKQQQYQTIRVTKEGYTHFELADVPIQTETEIPILLKPK